MDGDGVGDIAVGTPSDDDGGTNHGAVWVLFLNTDGTVKSNQKISDTEGGFTGVLGGAFAFGSSVASLGDLDGDGVGDIAVGTPGDDDGGCCNRGAVWVLFLNTDGTAKSNQKISDTEGNFTGELDASDVFGVSVASLGDLDGDGIGDLAVGARLDDDGGINEGALWVLFLNTDGTVKSHQKISNTEGGFTGVLDGVSTFGGSVVSLGDLDGDGVGDIAVGADGDDDGGVARGAVWVLFLNTDGTVKSHQKISDTEGGFTGTLDDRDRFGGSVACLGDLGGDGVGDIAVGAFRDDDGSAGPCDPIFACNRGAVWVLSLNADGTVKSQQKISSTEGGFTGTLEDGDEFGWSVGALGDLNGDSISDLAVGARLDGDGGNARGSVWVLFLDGVALTPSLDIKPGACPNPFNRHGHGVLPVALVGTAEFDPTEVDLSTLQLSRADGVGGSVAPNEGPPGPHSMIKDAARLFDGEPCDCQNHGPDGIDDLSMKFRTDELVEALELDDLPGGAAVELVLSGSLIDGTSFVANDCIVILPPGDTSPANAHVESTLADTFVEVAPLDLNFDDDGFADFSRSYFGGTVMTLTAPVHSAGRRFVRWLVDTVPQPIGMRSIEIIVTEDTTLKAVYARPTRPNPDQRTEPDGPLE